ncbi:co-chaperone HscB [Vibrio quintilis]|uniref:Co-chaperone protein HscB homolog n=1 Tax=Vibrio quintilis TaxID=1117707 RepID=A0A1M7YZN1_9VIBR|nr:co-chaperone HscB [Vibrio quintilis]SHO58101.1 hypothetical protein VQ7734_03871 [Vibrio quintilis]
MNYFELFGLPTQYELDGSLLASQFRELQKRFHPDNFASSSERERLIAVRKASEINDAYQTLKNEISRAEYILLIHGTDIRGEQRTMQDPEFLMEQMMLREELESIDQHSDEQALSSFETRVNSMYKEHLADFREQFELSSWEQAADIVRKLKFISKLKYEIEQTEEKMFG